ncbi:MAG: FAD-dependent oxidoreductase [bacterium]
MTELSHLFSPLKIGNVTVRNRILASAHITGFVKNGLPSERHLNYYEARAKGGAGLIIQEAIGVDPLTLHNPKVFCDGSHDGIIPPMKRIGKAVHDHGAKIFCQIAHGGSVMSSYHTWAHIESASNVPTAGQGEVPDALDAEGIERVIQGFVGTALRVKAAGYDGVELHFGHGYLHQQFLSPYCNVRTDEYGGSPGNRMRFGMQIIDRVRAAVGRDFVVGLRMSADELLQGGGYTLDDGKEFVRKWEATGKIDYVSVTVASTMSFIYALPPMMVPQRPFVYCAAEVKQVIDLPVFAAIRINDPVIANEIIKNNEADMVVMTRAQLCDPEMANKAREGRLDDIRQCVACNEGCWERLVDMQESITCMQNPEAGREAEFKITRTSTPKKVVVVGGGCAGMKAAVSARERGHEVVLYEKGDELGGAVLISSKGPGRQELSQVVRFLSHEIDRLGIPVHKGTEATADMIVKAGPDVVIIATGGLTIEDPTPEVVGQYAPIEIAPGADVVTAEDVLDGKAETGRRIVIADQQNYLKGMITAEFLADRGKEVTLVMPTEFRYGRPNPYTGDIGTLGVQILNLKKKKVTRIADHVVKKAFRGKIVLKDVYTEEEKELEADTLVLSYWRLPNNKLYYELKDKVPEIHRIGDALAPRRLINAIYDGHQAALNL